MRTDAFMPTRLPWLGLVLLLASCTPSLRSTVQTDGRLRPPTPAVEHDLQKILDKHRITTAGLGMLVDGKLVWALYHGEASPGIPANAATRFNVASITACCIPAGSNTRSRTTCGNGRCSLLEIARARYSNPSPE